MASLRDIRNRISSVKNTQQLTRAMKMVAAAKLRKAQERILQTRPYAYKIDETISHLKSQVDPAAHPLFQPREEVKAALLIVVAGDRGLAGSFNASIIKKAEEKIEADYADLRASGDLYLMCIGRKGHEHFARRGYNLVGDFRGVFNDLDFAQAQRAVKIAVEGFEEGQWDEVQIAYNEFKNTISQNRLVEPFLPIPSEQFITPVMEREIEARGDVAVGSGYAADYIFEPNAERILHVIVPKYLGYNLWRVLLESNASEQGARMVAMDNATTNAGELLGNLKLQYNRARQAAITTELIEIVSGANALEAG